MSTFGEFLGALADAATTINKKREIYNEIERCKKICDVAIEKGVITDTEVKEYVNSIFSQRLPHQESYINKLNGMKCDNAIQASSILKSLGFKYVALNTYRKGDNIATLDNGVNETIIHVI